MNTPVAKTITPFAIDLSEERFEELLDLTRLKPFWERVVDINPSGDLPYHNNHHMKYMASIAMQLFLWSWRGSDPRQRDTIGHAMLVSLGTAGLCHDIAHSGGGQPDYINVKNAKLVFNDQLFSYAPPAVESRWVERLITNSEFPYHSDPGTFTDECHRDADLLYATLMGDPKTIMEGLRAEIEVSQRKPVSHQEMLEGQRKFLGSCKFFTPGGKHNARTYQDLYLASLETYVKTLGV